MGCGQRLSGNLWQGESEKLSSWLHKAEEPASPINPGDPEATDEAGMDMEMTAEATSDAGAEAGADADLSQYISVDDESQTVTLTLIGGMGMANSNLNFNGRSRGDATVTVPEGYTVRVTFTNEGTLPHSAMVVPPEAVTEAVPTEVAFEGATTPNPNNGTNPGDTVEFEFVADQQGEYAILCAIPGHALGGQWIHIVVGAADAEASFVAHEPTQEGGGSDV